MKSIQAILCVLLFASRISSSAIPNPTVSAIVQEDEPNANAFKKLLNKVDEAVLHSILFNVNPVGASQNNHAAAEALYKKDPQLATHIVEVAKRQDGPAAANTTVVVLPSSTLELVPSSTILVIPPVTTSSSSSSAVEVLPVPTTASSTMSVKISILSTTITVTASPKRSVSASIKTSVIGKTISSEQLPTISSPSLQPSTSTVTLPPSSSTTTTVIVTNTPTTQLQPTSPTSLQSSTSVPQTSATSPLSTPQTTSSQISPRPSTSSNIVSSPSTTSTIPSSSTSSSSQGSEAQPTPSLVLVTSTLADGQAVTLTSFVGAPSATDSHYGGTQTTAAGSLQTPSGCSNNRPWTFAAVVAVVGMVIII